MLARLSNGISSLEAHGGGGPTPHAGAFGSELRALNYPDQSLALSCSSIATRENVEPRFASLRLHPPEPSSKARLKGPKAFASQSEGGRSQLTAVFCVFLTAFKRTSLRRLVALPEKLQGGGGCGKGLPVRAVPAACRSKPERQPPREEREDKKRREQGLRPPPFPLSSGAAFQRLFSSEAKRAFSRARNGQKHRNSALVALRLRLRLPRAPRGSALRS